jgi:hypothetical protein
MMNYRTLVESGRLSCGIPGLIHPLLYNPLSSVLTSWPVWSRSPGGDRNYLSILPCHTIYHYIWINRYALPLYMD